MKTAQTIYDILNQEIKEPDFDILIVMHCQKLKIKKFFQLLEKMKNKDPEFERTFGERSKREILEICAEKLIDFNRISFSKELKDKLDLHEAISTLPVFES